MEAQWLQQRPSTSDLAPASALSICASVSNSLQEVQRAADDLEVSSCTALQNPRYFYFLQTTRQAIEYFSSSRVEKEFQAALPYLSSLDTIRRITSDLAVTVATWEALQVRETPISLSKPEFNR
jgi:hypothetical protein